MRSCPARLGGIITSLSTLLLLASCGGGGGSKSTPPVPAKVTLTPAVASLVPGQAGLLSAAGLNSSGNALSGLTFTFTSSNTDFVTVANNGAVCAGTWDSLTSPVVCTPSTKVDTSLPADLQGPGIGKAQITAAVGSVNSDPITVYVHKPVDNITVFCVDGSNNVQACPNTVAACLSQTQKQQFKAKATARNSAGQPVDVTATVGTFNWTVTGTPATIDSSTGLATAAIPGKTQVFASASSTQSTPETFITCPINEIKLHVTNGTETSVTLATGGTKGLTADLTDSKGQPVTNVSLAYNSSQPLVAGGSSTVSASAAGTATTVASCTPQSCNIGLADAIYSNAFVTTVTGTSAVSTVYAASTQGTSVIPIPTDTNTPGTAITLKDKPNSMLFNHRGTSLYIGTATGLIVLTPSSSNAVTDPATSLPGRVLAVSFDDNMVLLSDGSAVYVYQPTASSGQVTKLNIAGAVAAAFAPDNSKAYIVGNGNWTVWSPTITPVPTGVGGPANDVTFIATGAFGYIAGSGSGLGAAATCNDTPRPGVATSNTAVQVRPLPDGQHLLALAPPNMDLITATTDNMGCPPDLQNSAVATALNSSGFAAPTGFATPQLIVTSDGTKAFVTSNQPGVLLGYDVLNRRSAPVQLQGGVSQTFTGGVTLDSKSLYVGTAGTNTVHKVDLSTGLDVTQIPVSFTPDLVAVQPK